MSNHHGQWQAQGDDIPKPGHRRMWGQELVPTKQQGREWLIEVQEMCQRAELRRREEAFRDAQRFLSRAPVEGYPSTMKPFYAYDDSYPNARVDLEIYGLAFQGPP
ncbi:MAG: hypothetical protein Q8S42_10705 [Archangium sp.]|nr:hypothetical protein [Archangium sp.]